MVWRRDAHVPPSLVSKSVSRRVMTSVLRLRRSRRHGLTASSGTDLQIRISHGRQQQAASAGIWLHSPDTSQGRRSVPELVFLLVAGVGFEPT
jgi:hypothetical protein